MEKLKLAGLWAASEEAATCSAAAADPDPVDLAASGSLSLGVKGSALHLKARAIQLMPCEHF